MIRPEQDIERSEPLRTIFEVQHVTQVYCSFTQALIIAKKKTNNTSTYVKLCLVLQKH